jgi:mannose-1-phosphate guanylyltransferase
MFYAVIMAGGSGTRLWPMSRRNRPKQSLKLFGERTLFQQAVDRLNPVFPPARILVVTKSDHVSLLRDQSPDLPVENFIIEPQGRGTAPALGLAAIHLQKRDPEAVMAVLTADHHIADAPAFHKVLMGAETAARADYLVGSRPLSLPPVTVTSRREKSSSWNRIRRYFACNDSSKSRKPKRRPKWFPAENTSGTVGCSSGG